MLPAQSAVEFALSVTDGKPTLLLTNQSLFGWATLTALELEVPTHTRVNEQELDPSALRTRRTRATRVSLQMEQTDLNAFCALRGTELGTHGVDELTLRAMDGYLSLGARVRVDGHVAEMTARLLFTATESGLRLMIDEACSYGFLPEPAPRLAHLIVSELLNVGAGRWARFAGLAEFDIDPVTAVLWNTMPPAGWRLPDTGELVCTSTRCQSGEVRSEFARVDPSIHNHQAYQLTENLNTFRPADELLHAGQIDSALRVYRAELSARGPEQPFLVERILTIAASKPEYFVDGLELARQALGRWPDFAPAHNALAAIACAENQGLEAAHRFRMMATSRASVGDKDASAKAALASARLLRRLSPAESTTLYELVLENSPNESEATEALSERYREEARWSDLIALIRRRVANQTDAKAAARDHVRLAKLLVDSLGDLDGARKELSIATALDRQSGVAAEALAKVEVALEDHEKAMVDFDNAAELFRQRGDYRSELRVRLAAADIAVTSHNDADAERRFQDILTDVPNQPQALRGAACAASRRHRFAEAAELWRMLLVSSADSKLTQAEYSFELGHCLVCDGDREGARPALERASRSGPPWIAAEAHGLLAEILIHDQAPAAAATQLAAAIKILTASVESLGTSTDTNKVGKHGSPPVRRFSRAAEFALERAKLLNQIGDSQEAVLEYQRAFELGSERHAVRREAAQVLLVYAEKNNDRAEAKR